MLILTRNIYTPLKPRCLLRPSQGSRTGRHLKSLSIYQIQWSKDKKTSFEGTRTIISFLSCNSQFFPSPNKFLTWSRRNPNPVCMHQIWKFHESFNQIGLTNNQHLLWFKTVVSRKFQLQVLKLTSTQINSLSHTVLWVNKNSKISITSQQKTYPL